MHSAVVRRLEQGSGRETLWISPSTEMRFRFHGSRPPTINLRWTRMLIVTAESPTGMHLVPEPPEGDAVPDPDDEREIAR